MRDAVVLIALASCGLLSCTGAKIDRTPLETSVLAKPTPTPSADDNGAVLRSNVEAAEAALRQAFVENDIKTVRAALKSQFFNIQMKAVQFITEKMDYGSIPDLATCLKRNQLVISGGSETQQEQNELSKALVDSLEQLLGRTFSVSKRLSSETQSGYNPFSEAELEEILNAVESWKSQNPKK